MNPFRLDAPAIVSFSGGRTSGYMLWKILEANGGELPRDVKACFQNTGREHDRTLDFVGEVERRWHVVIHWLEYMRRPGPVTTDGRTISCHGWLEVTANTASRKGQPFEQLLDVYADFRRIAKEKPPVLPNPVQRFCTGILKQRVLHWWVQDTLGWGVWKGNKPDPDCEHSHYAVALGLRSDEPDRVRDLTAAYAAIEPCAPLAEAGAKRSDVMEFWSRQSFDLGLSDDPRLGTYQGNCDFCFLKSSDKIRQAYRDDPRGADWWADQERRTGMRFRKDRFSMIDLVEGRVGLAVVDGDRDRGTCFCTD